MIYFLSLAGFILIAMVVADIVIVILLALVIFFAISCTAFLNSMYNWFASTNTKIVIQLFLVLIGGIAGQLLASISYRYNEYSIAFWLFYGAGFLSGVLGAWIAAKWLLSACRLLTQAAIEKSKDMYSEEI